MPHRCSVPGCNSTHRQGLSLLCYPKDPERRSAWLRSLRNNGMEPTNNQFVCELHFGPDQWEKVRVDGSRKLKWSGIPNVLDPEGINEALDRVRATPGRFVRGRNRPVIKTQSSLLPPNPTDPDFSPKLIKLDFPLVKGSQASEPSSIDLQPPSAHSDSSSEEKAGSPDISCDERDPLAPDLKANKVVTLFSHPPRNLNDPGMHSVVIDSVNPLNRFSSCSGSLQSTPSMPFEDPNSSAKSERQSTLQCTLPLSGKGHTIVVSMPKSRFQTRLSEDVEDVQSFLTGNERTYEERLVAALSELVKKHQLLDKKIQEVESLSKEHLSLKKQLEVHETVLLENYNLKVQLQNYEKKTIVENVESRNALLKTKIDGEGWTFDSNKNEETIYLQSEKNLNSLKRVVVVTPKIFRDGNLNSFASLDDQL
ncbi:uncharacterized protein LOC113205919 [Frankliniella occidentalis]|uniref:Uncharacterized protein LOC113205919 n=1 Tax=Frankliniella occidentalis TaxID=133901 RepID=A0A6J1SFW9_FRAOC|nr:uncharacterized protein LOC113205919 [Frankliniella occidentalis]